MAEANDILDALAGRPLARLPRWEQADVRKHARRQLAERHAHELADLEDTEARRRLASREYRLL